MDLEGARVRYVQNDGTARDEAASQLSATGLFVHGARPSPVNDLVKLSIDLPAGSTIQAQARVVYSNPRPTVGGSALAQGMGVKFTSMDESDRELLDLHLFGRIDRRPEVISIGQPAGRGASPLRTPRVREPDPVESGPLEAEEGPANPTGTLSRLGRWIRGS